MGTRPQIEGEYVATRLSGVLRGRPLLSWFAFFGSGFAVCWLFRVRCLDLSFCWLFFGLLFGCLGSDFSVLLVCFAVHVRAWPHPPSRDWTQPFGFQGCRARDVDELGPMGQKKGAPACNAPFFLPSIGRRLCPFEAGAVVGISGREKALEPLEHGGGPIGFGAPPYRRIRKPTTDGIDRDFAN